MDPPTAGVDVRESGRVTVRWLGMSDTEVDFDGLRVDDALCQAVRRWFPSNNSPDRMVLAIVIERDGEHMSDEQAEAYVRDDMAKARAVRPHRVPPTR